MSIADQSQDFGSICAPMPGETVPIALRLEQVSMGYGRTPKPANYVLAGIDLTISAGEFFVLIGPSGSGKSTLLKLIAGTELPNEGRVIADGKPVTSPGRERAMVFQSVDGPLFDWLTGAENIGFGLRISKVARPKLDAMVDHYVRLVGLAGHETKFPHELSGGMKQRVQIARTLAVEPDVVLMDEPLAALDALTRRVLQREIGRIWAETGKTFVYVTHDIREALLLGQRVGVMSVGPRATIRHTHRINLPFPRDDLDPEFINYSRQLNRAIELEATPQWTRS
jgi:NitT/TauT family transport system ATP-binding protein